MNSQEIFDKITSHLRQQNAMSSINYFENNRPVNACAYRGENGRKCAIGILIEDSEYKKEYEFKDIDSLMGMEDISNSLYQRLFNHVKLLRVFQTLHDEIPIKEWETNFKEIALQFNLNYIKPNNE